MKAFLLERYCDVERFGDVCHDRVFSTGNHECAWLRQAEKDNTFVCEEMLFERHEKRQLFLNFLEVFSFICSFNLCFESFQQLPAVSDWMSNSQNSCGVCEYSMTDHPTCSLWKCS